MASKGRLERGCASERIRTLKLLNLRGYACLHKAQPLLYFHVTAFITFGWDSDKALSKMLSMLGGGVMAIHFGHMLDAVASLGAKACPDPHQSIAWPAQTISAGRLQAYRVRGEPRRLLPAPGAPRRVRCHRTVTRRVTRHRATSAPTSSPPCAPAHLQVSSPPTNDLGAKASTNAIAGIF